MPASAPASAPAAAAITAETPLVASSAFDQLLDRLDGFPSWWLDLKREAWARHQALPMPRRNDELWRFSNVAGLRPATPFVPAPPAPDDLVRRLVAEAELVGRAHRTAEAVYVNDRCVSQDALADDLAARGVVFASLEQAVREHPEILRRHFMAQEVALGAEKFSTLHAAFTTAGALLYVPRGVEIELPFVVYHHAVGAGAAIFPHTLVVAEEQAKVTLIEFRLGAGNDDPTFSAGVCDIYAGPGARVNVISAQNYGRRSLGYQASEVVVQRDARVMTLGLHLGGRQTRHEVHSRLQGPGAHSEMLSLCVAHRGQEFDQRTLQSHQAPRTSSNLLYKNALFDDARTIFSGLIVVDPDAQKTDAYQSNRNLVCSPEAEANSLPGLEIQANDVRCTHGATTSRVDDEHLFYFASRGIPPAVAQELLVFGFFEEVLDKVPHDHVHEILRDFIRAKFRR
jgi:Fe-S cluster assembly protein SufD